MDSGNRRQLGAEGASATEGRAHPLLQETLLGEAAACLHAPFVVFGEDGELIAVNDAVCALTGWSRSELLQRSVDALLEDPAGVGWMRRELARRGRLVGTGALRTRRGDRIRVELVGAATAVGGVPYLAVVAVPDVPSDLGSDLDLEVWTRARGV